MYRVDNGSQGWKKTENGIEGEEAVGDQSVSSISLSADGKTVVIGAPLNDGNGYRSGHVRRVYRVDNGSQGWKKTGNGIEGEEAVGDQSDSSISLSADGKTVVIESSLKDGNGTDSGHVGV